MQFTTTRRISNMIPEGLLVAILIAIFIADFASAKDERRPWFNPMTCIYMGVLTLVCTVYVGAARQRPEKAKRRGPEANNEGVSGHSPRSALDT